jgi:glutathione synthase/RimK-type ligase-like ATP-grasp enzyme
MMIIRGLKELKTAFYQMGPRDIYIGSVAKKHLELPMMIDLLERGVTCLPFCLSQLLSRSKITQAFILNEWMPPLTCAIKRRIELLNAISMYNKNSIGQVITKEDQKHCGHGVRLWNDIESLYSVLGLEETSYPFVLQPLLTNFTDVRVIIVEDYMEAYARENPYNFRCNLAAGGKSMPFTLTRKQINLCKNIMERGRFPYAHIDLMILENEIIYLSEIALSGGLKGAKIDQHELELKKRQLLERIACKQEQGNIKSN